LAVRIIETWKRLVGFKTVDDLKKVKGMRSMNIFKWLKGSSESKNKPYESPLSKISGNSSDNKLLKEIIAFYSLAKKKPYEPSIMHDWWEGELRGRTIAFQLWEGKLFVYVGEVVEITEIYLERVSQKNQLPPEDSPQRLDRIVGEGSVLASQFYLVAYPEGAFDYPQLRLPALKDGIPKFSAAVDQIMICENFKGLSFTSDSTATREGIDADLKIALNIVRALEEWSTQQHND